MNKNLLVFIAFITILLAPNFVFAADFRGGNNINISDQEIPGNLYIGAGNSNINTNVNGDLTIASGESRVSGVVNGDLIILGGSVVFDGLVNGDVRIVGGDVKIKGNVTGELVVVGGDVLIEKEASVNGATFLLGGLVQIDSKSDQNIKVLGGKVVLNSEINGHIEITTQDLNLTNNAKINGYLSYFAPEKFNQDIGSEVLGEVSYNQIKSIEDNGLIKQTILSFINFWILLRFITTLLLAFILVYVFKVFSQKTTEFTLDNFGVSILIGLLIIFVVPIISVILFASLIGMPISVLLFLTLIFAMIISPAVAGIILGALFKKVYKKTDNIEVSFHTATLGVVLLSVVKFVPFLGEIISLLFFTVALGGIAHYIYMNIRWAKEY